MRFVAVGFVKVTEDGEPLKGVWPNVNKKGFVLPHWEMHR